MNTAVDVIAAKRDGGALSREQINALIEGLQSGDVADYQMSAFLMAVYQRGMNATETAFLTQAMLQSGGRLDLSSVDRPKIDKHSTGGVGDKISLILAPLAAACGLAVPMISGRGLGFSGGTLDKLESIPGFDTQVQSGHAVHQLKAIGVVMMGQTEQIVPADRKMYALRDVTATVPCIPLIVSSILSKKLAEDLDGLVLDVKSGTGAFMQSHEQAVALGDALKATGEELGLPTRYRLTNMDEPLGFASGNWPEVDESIRCLKGEEIPQVTELSCELVAEMVLLGKVTGDLDAARALARKRLADGSAWSVFEEIVSMQGGSLKNRTNKPHELVVSATEDMSGWISGINARTVGELAITLGAGRRIAADTVDPEAGIVLHAKTGHPIAPGQPIASLFSSSRIDKQVGTSLLQAVSIDANATEPVSVFLDA